MIDFVFFSLYKWREKKSLLQVQKPPLHEVEKTSLTYQPNTIMNPTTYDNLTDLQIVERLTQHYDYKMESWFFSVYCAPILQSINRRFFRGEQPMEKLTNDFYLHLKQQDWHALRQYSPTGALRAWLTTVATHLFLPRLNADSIVTTIDDDEMAALLVEEDNQTTTQHQEKLLSIAKALDSLPNRRYQYILEGIYYRYLSPQQLADEMGITLPNFYNLHRRALAALQKNFHSMTAPS